MKKFLQLLIFMVLALPAVAEESLEQQKAHQNFEQKALTLTKDSSKVRITFGGCLDVRLQYNSYNSFLSRDMINMYPYAPDVNSVGVDLNDFGDLGFSVFSSRLAFTMDNFKVMGADAKVYFEGDFLGTSDTYLQMFRMRHAYFALQWEKDRVLMGQTGILLSNFDDLMANTVDFGAGVPFTALNRGVQVRYERDFAPKVKLRVAAEMYGLHQGVSGSADAMAASFTPDLQAQMVFGNRSGKSALGGFTVGAKALRPRKVTELGYVTTKRVASYVGSGFAKFFVAGHKVQMMATFGTNMSAYTLWGGYGMIEGQDVNSDYDYANIMSTSEWIDIDSPMFGKWQYGLFFGHQHNLGSTDPLDATVGYYKDANLQWFFRLAPRVWYRPAKKVAFGLEYSFNGAQWAEEVNSYFRSVKNYDVSYNHRAVFLAKYIF